VCEEEFANCTPNIDRHRRCSTPLEPIPTSIDPNVTVIICLQYLSKSAQNFFSDRGSTGVAKKFCHTASKCFQQAVIRRNEGEHATSLTEDGLDDLRTQLKYGSDRAPRSGNTKSGIGSPDSGSVSAGTDHC